MTSDGVRAATFPFRFNGYSPVAVAAWLNRVADLIDSGDFDRSDFPRERFLTVMRGYDRRAVDRFISELADGVFAADTLAARSRSSGRTASRTAQPAKLLYANSDAWRYRDRRDKPFRERYRQDCDALWAKFPDLAGTRLRMTGAQISHQDGRALMTGRRDIFTEVASGRVFRIKRRWTGSVEIVDDLTGQLIISWSGRHQQFEAESVVSRGGEPWLWFPVRGTSPKNAVMQAIDASGNEILSFRQVGRNGIEVIAGPDVLVSHEILCVIAIASPLLEAFSASPSSGGG